MGLIIKVIAFAALMCVTTALLSDEDQQKIVEQTNALREAVSDIADPSTMKTVVWKDDLAEIAQEHADKCVQAHNADRKTQAQARPNIIKNNIGENIAWGVDDLTTLFKAWADEKPLFHADTNTCAAGTICGHYKQLVWAKTYAMGCGINLGCKVDNVIQPILVCNYEPGVYGTNAPYVYGF